MYCKVILHQNQFLNNIYVIPVNSIHRHAMLEQSFGTKNLKQSILNKRKDNNKLYALDVLDTKHTNMQGRWNILVLQLDFLTAKNHLSAIIATLLTTATISPIHMFNSPSTHSLNNSTDSDFTSLSSTIAKCVTLNLSKEKYSHIPTNINYSVLESTA